VSVLDHVTRIENKVDKLDDKVNHIDKTLATNTQSLRDHMRRTQILEDRLSPGKIIAIIVGITTIVLGIVKIYVLLGGH